MSETIIQVGIAFSFDNAGQLAEKLEGTGLGFYTDTFDNKIEFIEFDDERFEFIQGDGKVYLFFHLYDPQASKINIYYSSIEELIRGHSLHVFEGRPHKLFVVQWYSGMDAPFVDWNW